MRRPIMPSSAGRSVSEANMVKATASAEATAGPRRKVTPSRSMPSSATITVVPAKKTARPAVSIAVTTASWTSSPSRRPERNRVTTKSA